MTRILCLLAILLPAAAAHACLFAQDAQPKDWLEWASVLLAADVTAVEQVEGVDNVTLAVVATFKGPAAAKSATVRVPSRMWMACGLQRPAIGQRVLAALNSHGDALIVPLGAQYAEQLWTAVPAKRDGGRGGD